MPTPLERRLSWVALAIKGNITFSDIKRRLCGILVLQTTSPLKSGRVGDGLAWARMCRSIMLLASNAQARPTPESACG